MKTNWPIEKFENCIESVKYTTKIPSKDYKETGKFPIISQEEDLISGFWDDEVDVYKIEKPIVIFGDHTKVIKYIDFDFVLGADGVKILQPKDFLDAKFFMYFLKNANIKSLGYARHYRLLKELNVPLPPLEEQKRIVIVLDKKFAQIETLKTVAEKNLQNAKQLFQAELEKAFSNLQYATVQIKDITTKIGSGATPKGGKTSYVEEGISLIRSMNVYPFKFEYENLAHITDQQAKELQNVEIKQKDVLFNITGASIARCCVVPDDVLPARVNQHVSILRCKGEIINPNYLCSIMNSPKSQKILLGIGEAGSTRQALTKSDLENFTIPLPPLEEQKRIVAHLDSLSEKVHQLEEIYTKQLADCDELKQSLLQKAFEGEL